MPLGEHLGADQDIDALLSNVVLHCLPGMLAPGAVAVDAQDARVWEVFVQRLLDALRTLAQTLEILVTARRAGTR